jgi:hypothetical protein
MPKTEIRCPEEKAAWSPLRGSSRPSPHAGLGKLGFPLLVDLVLLCKRISDRGVLHPSRPFPLVLFQTSALHWPWQKEVWVQPAVPLAAGAGVELEQPC